MKLALPFCISISLRVIHGSKAPQGKKNKYTDTELCIHTSNGFNVKAEGYSLKRAQGENPPGACLRLSPGITATVFKPYTCLHHSLTARNSISESSSPDMENTHKKLCVCSLCSTFKQSASPMKTIQ